MRAVCSVGHREVGGGGEGRRKMGGEQGSGAHETYQYPHATKQSKGNQTSCRQMEKS